jgi:hypothetical protein
VRRDAEAPAPADAHPDHAAVESGDDPAVAHGEGDGDVALEDVAAMEGAVVADDDARAALGDRAVARPVVLDVDALQAGWTSTRVSL